MKKISLTLVALTLIWISVASAGITVDGSSPVTSVPDPKLRLAEAELNRQLPREPRKALEYLIKTMNEAEIASLTPTALRFELVYTGPTAEPVRVEPIFDRKQNVLMVQLQVRSTLANNSVAVLEALTALNATLPLTGSVLKIVGEKEKPILEHLGLQGLWRPFIKSTLNWAELAINAKAGDAFSQLELAKFDLETLPQLEVALNGYKLRAGDSVRIGEEIAQLAAAHGVPALKAASPEDAWTRFGEAREAQLKNLIAEKTKLAKVRMKEMREGEDAIKAQQSALEAQPEKLEDLVKKNDREGVAKLLEAYVPWRELTPTESISWRQWIEAIRRPNRQDASVLFRGIDKDDFVQVAKDAAGKATGYGFFPTLLTKNQGNYTRRLRSIRTMRYKFGNLREDQRSPLEVTPRLFSIMANHASDPKGSPFMSFTNSVLSASEWAEAGGGGIVAVKIDKRRVFANITSVFASEREFLVPMIVFPDEVVLYQKKEAGQYLDPEKFVAEVSRRLGVAVAADPLIDAESLRPTYELLEKAQRLSISQRSCRGVFGAKQ